MKATDVLLVVSGVLGTSSSNNGSDDMTNEAKNALLALFRNAAYATENGETYYDALEAALFPPVNVVSISAVFTQGIAVIYDTDSLDVLRQYLVVTATYDDTSSEVVTTYTLSGTLTAGTSTITASYGGKTDTFTVTVTHANTYVTNGLIHRWDGIDNTGSGHNASAVTWADLVGSTNLTLSTTTNISWGDNSLNLNGVIRDVIYANTIDNPSACTLEVCFESTGNSATTVVMVNPASGTGSRNAREVVLFADNTVSGIGASSKSYTNTEASIANIRTISVDYTDLTINHLYINGTATTQGNTTHSFQYSGSKEMYVGGVDTNYKFYGKVFSIRIYNRALTAQEIADNYAYDVERFELGGGS